MQTDSTISLPSPSGNSMRGAPGNCANAGSAINTRIEVPNDCADLDIAVPREVFGPVTDNLYLRNRLEAIELVHRLKRARVLHLEFRPAIEIKPVILVRIDFVELA